MNNKYQRTLWMGNIESWMTDSFLTKFLNSIHIFPKGITLKNPQNKLGCAFLEFASKEQAEFILKNFNGKNINNFIIKFNRVKTFDEKFSTQKITKFTVSKRQNNFNYFKPS
jgi:RNA recognition motif-containing protein